jgi:hypothetical protein
MKKKYQEYPAKTILIASEMHPPAAATTTGPIAWFKNFLGHFQSQDPQQVEAGSLRGCKNMWRRLMMMTATHAE